MKTKFLTLFIAVLALAGCKKEIKLKVETIHTTEKTSQWEITVARPAFSTTEKTVDNSCVIFNDKVTAIVNGLQDSLRIQAKQDFASMEADGVGMTGTYQLVVEDSVFMGDEDYISVRLLVYTFTGGAHGMREFYGLNYDVKNQKFLENNEIINLSKATDINDLLKAHLQDPDSCFTMDVPNVNNFCALNISLHTVEFTYAQYILGPYSCGFTTIAIPRAAMKGMLLIK